ncbi:polyprenyl synthetase family protein [Halobacillus kuroshimensis]|uniref:polyprenyl synthetase family protein n=1 Tax=Halobacillus kuroshimensis TaxID=302481 RepID=UPI000411A027|nr:polyprenyl synthetase family protein [Halobacillus kuroshimensis]
MGMFPGYSPDHLYSMMVQAVKTHMNEAGLARLAERFISYKKAEGFSFSPLTQLHFHIHSREKQEGVYVLSAAIEFLILALDILDDLQDEDAGDKPWSQVSSASSMNISTGFLMLSMQLMQASPFQKETSSDALQAMHQQVLQAVNGQHADLNESASTEEEFLRMIKRKSGSLMACACMAGAAFCENEDLSGIRLYAESFGIAAQLVNDLQDIVRFDSKNDLINKKWTLPVFLLLQERSEEAGWIRDYYEGRVDGSFITDRKQPLFEWVSRSAVIPYIQVLIRKHQRQASRKLDMFQAGQEWKEQMRKRIEDL